MAPLPFTAAKDGVRVGVRVTPKAARNAIEGMAERAGGPRLKVRVTATPARGKANAAVLKLLAEEWDVTSSDLEVISGATHRDKTIHVAGEPDALLRKLAAWAKRRYG